MKWYLPWPPPRAQRRARPNLAMKMTRTAPSSCRTPRTSPRTPMRGPWWGSGRGNTRSTTTHNRHGTHPPHIVLPANERHPAPQERHPAPRCGAGTHLLRRAGLRSGTHGADGGGGYTRHVQLPTSRNVTPYTDTGRRPFFITSWGLNKAIMNLRE